MTSIPIEIKRLTDGTSWRWVFRTLADQRTEPFLRMAGVPANMLENPLDLQGASRHFLAELDQLPARRLTRDARGGSWSEEHVADLRLLLEATFHDLAKAYGVAAARDLYGWGMREEVDVDRRNELSHLAQILPRLAGLREGLREDRGSTLSPRGLARFEEIVNNRFDQSWLARLNDEIDRAKLQARSPEVPPSAVDSSDDEPLARLAGDELDFIYLAILREQARRAREDLKKALPDRDLDALLAWMRSEAPALGIRPADVKLQ